LSKTDDALKNTKLVPLLIKCDRFSCCHPCGLSLWENRYTFRFYGRRMKTENRQIFQKLAARLWFLCC